MVCYWLIRGRSSGTTVGATGASTPRQWSGASKWEARPLAVAQTRAQDGLKRCQKSVGHSLIRLGS